MSTPFLSPTFISPAVQLTPHRASFEMHVTILLSSDDFGVEGARHLAGIIRSNKTIKHLYLGLNNFGEEGSKIIADALKENNVSILFPHSFSTFAFT